MYTVYKRKNQHSPVTIGGSQEHSEGDRQEASHRALNTVGISSFSSHVGSTQHLKRMGDTLPSRMREVSVTRSTSVSPPVKGIPAGWSPNTPQSILSTPSLLSPSHRYTSLSMYSRRFHTTYTHTVPSQTQIQTPCHNANSVKHAYTRTHVQTSHSTRWCPTLAFIVKASCHLPIIPRSNHCLYVSINQC